MVDLLVDTVSLGKGSELKGQVKRTQGGPNNRGCVAVGHRPKADETQQQHIVCVNFLLFHTLAVRHFDSG